MQVQLVSCLSTSPVIDAEPPIIVICKLICTSMIRSPLASRTGIFRFMGTPDCSDVIGRIITAVAMVFSSVLGSLSRVVVVSMREKYNGTESEESQQKDVIRFEFSQQIESSAVPILACDLEAISSPPMSTSRRMVDPADKDSVIDVEQVSSGAKAICSEDESRLLPSEAWNFDQPILSAEKSWIARDQIPSLREETSPLGVL